MNGTDEKTPEKLSGALPDGSEYWEKLAGKYHIAKYVAAAILVLFVLLTSIIGQNEMKAGNFRYLFKYFQINPFSSSAAYEDISYTGNPDMRFSMYKGDLAVICDGRLTLYNMAGRRILSVDTGGADTVDGSGKYLAVYKRGNKKVTLYNSFSEVYNFESDYPVTEVKTESDGGFAVVTSEKDMRSSVIVYSKAFSPVYKWKSADKYVSCIALTAGHEYLGIFATGTSSGIPFSELIVKKTRNDDTLLDVKFEGEQPYGIFFSDSGGIIAITDKAARFYNKKGVSEGEYIFEGKLLCTDFSDDVLLLAERKTGETGTLISSFASGGKKLALYSVGNAAQTLASYDGNIYVLGYDTVTLIRGDGTAYTEKTDGGAKAMFLLDDGSALLCYTYGTELSEPRSGK